MQTERKLEILSAERRFAVSSRLAAALAERGFYVLGRVDAGDGLAEAEPPSFPAPLVSAAD